MKQHLFHLLLLMLFSMPVLLQGQTGERLSSPDTGTGMQVLPLGGNAWRKGGQGGAVTNAGVTGWTDPATRFEVYVRTSVPGRMTIALRARVPQGSSRLSISIGSKSRELSLTGASMQSYPVGDWEVTDTGYCRIRIRGLARQGEVFADLESLELGGSAINGQTAFVKDNEGNFFHWGRRGPSVHLNYIIPDTTMKAEWFYNEITVPQHRDVTGSYFMAAGFGEGYFGIQVNSGQERRILFSVWSPFNTDNPAAIPDSQKIRLLKKGAGVHAGEFGNEGSGGQSYLRYGWKAGVRYGFLLHAVPTAGNHTEYTAYFFDPALHRWALIASFSRPQTSTYIKRPHSFLENFIPETGDTERRVLFSNQWVCDPSGRWAALTRARFTGDNTARKGYRMDYGGGVEGDAFYLRNCGFFDRYTPLDLQLERRGPGTHPVIGFNKLP